jgi:protein O-mannosyl-transferase
VAEARSRSRRRAAGHAGPGARAAAGPRLDWRAPLLVFAFAFGLYAGTIGNSYTADDAIFTTGNRFVQQGVAGIPHLFARGSMAGFDNTDVGLYRPLVLVSFAVEIALVGNDPHVHHLVNVLLFAITAVLLLVLLRRMFPNAPPAVPLIVTLLYVFHPVHTEVVASIKGRDDLLAWLFGTGALLQVLAYARTRAGRPLLAAGALFLAALLCKESLAALLLVVPMLLVWCTRLDAAAIARATAPWAVTLGVWLAMRAAVIKSVMFNQPLTRVNNALVAAGTPMERLATNFVVLLKYLGLLVFPRQLTWDYSYNQIPIVGWGAPAAVLSLALYVALGAFAIVTLRRRSPYAFGILFYLVTLAPSSNLVFLIGSTMGERFLYVPSLGFCVVLGFLLWRVFGASRARALYAVTGVVLALYAIRTVTRNRDWRDSFALFSAGVRVSSHSARAQGAMGTQFAHLAEAEPDSLRRAGWYRLARDRYQTMVDIDPDDAEGWYGLGTVRMALGDSTAALPLFRETIRRRPNYAPAYTNIGVIHFRRGDLDSAESYFRASLVADSLSVDALADLGAVHLVRGQAREAIALFDRALALEPGRRSALENRRKAWLLLGDTLRANSPI